MCDLVCFPVFFILTVCGRSHQKVQTSQNDTKTSQSWAQNQVLMDVNGCVENVEPRSGEKCLILDCIILTYINYFFWFVCKAYRIPVTVIHWSQHETFSFFSCCSIVMWQDIYPLPTHQRSPEHGSRTHKHELSLSSKTLPILVVVHVHLSFAFLLVFLIMKLLCVCSMRKVVWKHPQHAKEQK